MKLISHDEAEALREKSLRQQKVSSVLLAILIHVVIILGLALWVIVGPPAPKEEISVQFSNNPEFKPVTKRETAVSKRKPSPPSSSTKMITAATTSEVFVPQVDAVAPVDIGTSDELGFGLGLGGFGGGGGGGGEAVFFNQKASAERVLFVVDYSASMKGTRDRLMRSELANTLKLLGDGVQYQMIFFAGPAWVAGGKPDILERGQDKWKVTNNGKEYDWRLKGKNFWGDWKPTGAREKVEWITKSSGTLDASLDAVKSTPLILGTAWEEPLEMAFDMEPKPQIIFFMTDGSTSGALETSKKMGSRAKRYGIPINTIALMDPKAVDGMRDLAERSGGKFTIVAADGSSKEEDFAEK